jgi:hypothetical protein
MLRARGRRVDDLPYMVKTRCRNGLKRYNGGDMSVNSIFSPPAATLLAAFATLCTAVTSLLVWITQRQSLLENARPVLVLTDWSRSYEKKDNGACIDTLRIKNIKNVGHGSAFTILLTMPSREKSNARVNSRHIGVIGPGERISLDGEITLVSNIGLEDKNYCKSTFFAIHLYAWDSRNRRHITRYLLQAADLSSHEVMTDEVAARVAFCGRFTKSRSKWLVNLISKVSRICKLG